MTGRLQLIEQKLLAIDSAGFQNLCDTYLLLREEEFISFNRTGSQSGKQKTIKGTPDTFYRLANGTLGFVEYTTQADNVTKKIIEDIDKCLDETKTSIPATEIRKITICYNSRLDTSEEAEIIKYAQSKRVQIELVGMDRLAIEICSKYLILAKDFLGMPLDTGQVLPVQKFIEEYNNKAGKLATPIDNIFLHRVKELQQIENILTKENLLIIAGFPGVGKTKLGIEAIERFCKTNNSFHAYAIAKKDVDIHDDLRILIQSDKDYIILVDDANRQLPNLLQILGVLGETRKGKLKLILTVRNYAYQDIMGICQDHAFESIEVKKFSDDEIREIISSDSFQIRHPKYQKKIIEISDGNARLAVMAAKIAREQQHEFLWGDVSDLYDSYFERVIKDFDLAKDKPVLKALGIISFFFSIHRNDKEFLDKLLKLFGLNYYEFNEAIDELHKQELVEVQYDIVRVSDQILATYIFYKVFIKEQLLPYRVLLDNYFPKWTTRFRDTIIPANNSFGYDNVLGKIDGVLNEYLAAIYHDDAKVLDFFSLFWFYKPVETLAYFHNKIKQLPDPAEAVYSTDYESNQLTFGRNKTLEFLSNFFHYNTENTRTALELAFEYCRKNPDDLPDLIKHIREKFRFDEEDEVTRFAKQIKLFELLREKFLKGEAHYISSFFPLSKTFLARQYQVTKGGRKNTIVFYDYPLPFNPTIKEFRKIQWQFLMDIFDRYPDEVLDVLKSFGPHIKEDRKNQNDLLAYDLTFLVSFIEQKLDPSSFKHIHYVHTLVAWLNREELTDRSYQKLKSKFYNTEYEDFLKLDWDRFRDKEIFEFDDYKEYETIKANDLKHSFTFEGPGDFPRLHKGLANIIAVKDNMYGVSNSLDIVVEETFIKNNQLGFDLFRSLMDNYPSNIGPLYKSIKAICSIKDWSKELFKILIEWKHQSKIQWLFIYFECVPVPQIDGALVQALLRIVDEIDNDTHIWFESFENFEATDSRIFEKILQRVVTKIERDKINIRLSHNFFEKYSDRFQNNFELLGKAYLQQDEIDPHSDLLRHGLQKLILIDPKFLLTYIDKMYVQKEDYRSDSHNHLNFVWDLDIPDSLIEEAINLVVDGSHYFGISEHSVNIFFNNLTTDQLQRAKKFTLQYITKHANDEQKINSIFDAIRHRMKEFQEEAFLHFLDQNHEVDFFKKIWWRGNGGGVVSGDVNFGELEEADWIKVLKMVEKYPNQLDVLRIKAHLKQEIAYAIKRAEGERQRKFANPEWPF
jgi:hypothetical protein